MSNCPCPGCSRVRTLKAAAAAAPPPGAPSSGPSPAPPGCPCLNCTLIDIYNRHASMTAAGTPPEVTYTAVWVVAGPAATQFLQALTILQTVEGDEKRAGGELLRLGVAATLHLHREVIGSLGCLAEAPACPN